MSLNINLAAKPPPEPLVDELHRLVKANRLQNGFSLDRPAGNGIRLLYYIWRLLSDKINFTTFVDKNKRFATWLAVIQQFDICAICQFFFETLCGNMANVETLVDLFGKACTLRSEMTPYSALVPFLKLIRSSVRPKNQSYIRLWVYSSTAGHISHYIPEDFIALTCAISYWNMISVGAKRLPPTWMLDGIVRIHGMHTTLTQWKNWFPDLFVPLIDGMFRHLCKECPAIMIAKCIDIASTVILPITYMQYALGRAWEATPADHAIYPRMQKRQAAFRGAVYAYSKYLTRTYPHLSAQAIFSFINQHSDHGWKDPPSDTAFKQLYEELYPVFANWGPQYHVYWVEMLFADIDPIVRHHCINPDAYSKARVWHNYVDVVPITEVPIERANAVLDQEKMAYEKSILHQMSASCKILEFSLKPQRNASPDLDIRKTGNRRKRTTTIADARNCIDIYTTLWLYFENAKHQWGRSNFRILRISNHRGFLVIDRDIWNFTFRGLQWAVSLTPSVTMVRRCPAYMAVMNMALHPAPQLNRWALICVATLISGFAPFSEHAAIADIPEDACEVHWIIEMIIQVLMRCRVVYGSMSQMIVQCTCADHMLLHALWGMIRLKATKRMIGYRALTELRNYLLADDNSLRITTMLEEREQRGNFKRGEYQGNERKQFKRLCKSVLADDVLNNAAAMKVDDCAAALYFICANPDYIHDHNVALSVFSGIYIGTANKTECMTRHHTMWNTMVNISRTNLFPNYFEKKAGVPVATKNKSLIIPVARKDTEFSYNVLKDATYPDIKLFSELVFYLEISAYLEYPDDAFKGRRIKKREREDESVDEISMDDMPDTGSRCSSKQKRIECDMSNVAHSEASRSMVFPFDPKTSVKDQQTMLKSQLGKDKLPFPYVDPESYSDVAYQLPLGIDPFGNVVFEKNAMIMPQLPLRLAPEEVNKLRHECMVGPLACVSNGFLYALLCCDFDREQVSK